ncbi:PIN domain-containing protein [Streptomyces sp. JJ66]|uniref:PIN domain-containing protein n=1 Tax=Streptomyces sp. JJ66 TaxID=2803843 RepID=UPI001C58A13D|nr:PIN domain-containing protein [Streptomyces sp. JJ66]MBW1601367.1 PIN domain-containing protein [Streptomyces sp. JJ66]
MSVSCYVLDCEAVSRAARGEEQMAARLKFAHGRGIRVVTSSMTLIEAHHARIRRAAWQWTLSRITVEPVTEEVADAAIKLLADAGLHGHKYAIDAALAVIAAHQAGNTVVFTSDEDDLKKLCGARILVRRL